VGTIGRVVVGSGADVVVTVEPGVVLLVAGSEVTVTVDVLVVVVAPT